MWIYLASQSPRRAQLLEQLGISHRLLIPQTETEKIQAEALEDVLPGEHPADYVQRVTALKAQSAYVRWQQLQIHDALAWPAAPILCADTTVALDGVILGKPADAEAAHQMLTQLSARTHQVLTAVTLLNAAHGCMQSALSISQVQFKSLSATEIRNYIASGEPFGKAGAYGIQGTAARFVVRLEGSYTGIMGLPLYETAQLLGV